MEREGGFKYFIKIVFQINIMLNTLEVFQILFNICFKYDTFLLENLKIPPT